MVSSWQGRPRQQCVTHGRPVGMRQDRRRNEQRIEDREAESDSLPGPITARGNDDKNENEGSAYRNSWPNSKKTQAGAHTDEFRHQRQEVSENQISHCEKAPKSPEPVEDQLRVSSVSDCAEPHRHFLNHIPHHEREHNEGNEKTNTKARARSRVREHAWCVILAKKNQNPRADEQPKQREPAKKFRPPFSKPSACYPPSVPGAINVLMRQRSEE